MQETKTADYKEKCRDQAWHGDCIHYFIGQAVCQQPTQLHYSRPGRWIIPQAGACLVWVTVNFRCRPHQNLRKVPVSRRCQSLTGDRESGQEFGRVKLLNEDRQDACPTKIIWSVRWQRGRCRFFLQIFPLPLPSAGLGFKHGSLLWQIQNAFQLKADQVLFKLRLPACPPKACRQPQPNHQSPPRRQSRPGNIAAGWIYSASRPAGAARR